MSETFEIGASPNGYRVEIRAGVFDELISTAAGRLVIADSFFAPRLADAGLDPILIDPSEDAKALDRMAPVIEAVRRAGATRNTVLVAIGGGVVQDICGFVAQIYMRGMPWIYAPTTLVGMADSCIGGKSSINVGAFKNLVGGFYPPQTIHIDPALAASLSMTQRVAGLCEIAKIAWCRSPQAFAAFEGLELSPDSDVEAWTQAISLSLRAKQWFIEVDEFDRAERLQLNFGHSFGHAIESASGYAISHGIAVGLGMLCARRMGESVGRDYARCWALDRLEASLVQWLRAVPELGGHVASLDPDALIRAFGSDKKHTPDHWRLILPRSGGGVDLMELPRSAEIEDKLRGAFKSLEGRIP